MSWLFHSKFKFGFESLWMSHPDSVRTEAWFLPGLGVDSDHPGPLVVYAHGNGELIDNNTNLAHELRALGISTLLIEYRGYGRSEGRPSQIALVADAQRWIERMRQRKDIDATKVLYWGRSIGAGVTGELALLEEPAGLILQTGLLRCDRFAWRFGIPPLLMRHPFRLDLALPQVMNPVLILQHTRDQIAPIEDGRTMKQLVPGQVRLIELDGTHNQLASEAEYERQRYAINEFCSRVLGLDQTQDP